MSTTWIKQSDWLTEVGVAWVKTNHEGLCTCARLTLKVPIKTRADDIVNGFFFFVFFFFSIKVS